MSRGQYGGAASTGTVEIAQVHLGSRRAIARREWPQDEGSGTQGRPDITTFTRDFIQCMYTSALATVSNTRPTYVQFLGSSIGFVYRPHSHTLAWSDFCGSQQHITTGDLDHDTCVALFFMSYLDHLRLKAFAQAAMADVRRGRRWRPQPAVEGYDARVERPVTHARSCLRSERFAAHNTQVHCRKDELSDRSLDKRSHELEAEMAQMCRSAQSGW